MFTHTRKLVGLFSRVCVSPSKQYLDNSIWFFYASCLRYKGFHSVHISLQAVANSRTNESLAHIWITRLTVARLLNHWNHSVLLFDSDAIMLRNIHPLLSKFSDSDIIASADSYPKDLNKKWNAPTICMGFILIKCSAATG